MGAPGGTLLPRRHLGFRAAAFFRCGVSLPGLSGEERSFWNRCQTAPGATLFLADSHALATDPCVLEDVGHISHLDAHHDAGYGGPASAATLLADGEVDCGNWLLAAMLQGTHAEVVYPTWKPRGVHERAPSLPVTRRVDDGAPLAGPFDRVFLCRSGAWTPPWVEDAFWDLVDAWPGAGRVWLEDVTRRHWKNQESSAWEMVDQWKTQAARAPTAAP